MKLFLFSSLSKINKALLPKIWKTADLANLSNREKLVLGWKRWVTFKFLDEIEKREKQNSKK